MLQINRIKLNEILHAFYDITGVRIAVTDEWYNEIAAFPEEICALCRRLRTNREIDQKCRETDARAFAYAKEHQSQYTYKCHMNLYESVVPICVEGVTVGYIMIGQFIDQKDAESIRIAAERAVGTEERLAEEIAQLKSFDKKTVESIACIMGVCSEYLCFSKAVTAKSAGTAKKAEIYIREHLNEKLTVDSLAAQFRISRTNLYYLFKKTYGKGITEFINSVKIERARELIQAGADTERILAEIHIDDANYFSRMFRKYSRIGYREYRRKYAGKIQFSR